MTPEGRVKKKIKNLFDEYGDNLYYYMPVPGGYGKRTVDYLGCIRGVFFAAEAKRPGGKPTLAQDSVLGAVQQAGGSTFVIDDDDDVVRLKRFLDHVMELST